MTIPTVVDVPHGLGRAEAKRRLTTRIGELPGHLPGGFADVRAAWPGEYRMALEVATMGQTLPVTLDVEDRVIRVSMVLPWMLSMMADAIATAVRDKGGAVLLGDDRAD